MTVVGLYSCEVWQTRADDVRSASVAFIAFGRFLMLAGGKVSDHCYNVILLFMFTTDLYHSSTEAALLEEMSVF